MTAPETALEARAREVLAAEYERAMADNVAGRGERFHAANVRVIGRRDYADWKDHAALAAMLAFRAEAIEEAVQAVAAVPDEFLVFWDRPGGPPGNGLRPAEHADYIAAIRSLMGKETGG